MRPVTSQFLNVIRGSHQIALRVRVLTSFQTGVNPTGTELLVVDGNVHLNATADVRATVDLEVDGTGAFTRDPGGLLTPYGNEVFVERGVIYGTGTHEYVSLGYFRIYEVEQSNQPDYPIRLGGRDRMSGIVDGRLIAPVQFVAGTSISAIFNTLVQEIYPTATIQFDYNATTDLLQTSVVADEDRYSFLRNLVTSRGKIMYWDHAGRLQVKDAPNVNNTVFDINSGEDGVLIEVSRRLDRGSVYNAVVTLGEQVQLDVPPVRGVARDMNPLSPTFWDGPFGKVPRFFSSPFVTTQAQAESASSKILARSIGLPYSVTLSAVPNPALEPYDPIKVTRSDGYDKHLIQEMTIPLNVDRPMTINTREQTTVDIVTGDV